MKLLDTIIISLATGLFIIGVHQTFYFGIAASYWLFMLSLSLVFYLKLNKRKSANSPEKDDKTIRRPTKTNRKNKKTIRR